MRKRTSWSTSLLLGLLLCAAAILAVGRSQAAPVAAPQSFVDTFMTNGDVTIYENNPTTNIGNNINLDIGLADTQSASRRQILLAFDDFSLPAEAVVVSATLRLYPYYTQSNAPQEPNIAFNAYADAITGPWGEMSVTWNSAPTREHLSDPPTLLTGSASPSYWNVFGIVNAWQTGSHSNYGILLRGSQSLPTVYSFYAREGGSTIGAELTVEYNLPGITPSPTATSTRTPTPTLTPLPMTVINFEDQPGGTWVQDQYSGQGVHFFNDFIDESRYWAAPQVQNHTYASSGSQVLVNQYSSYEFANSADIGMGIWFDSPKQAVSMNLTALGNPYVSCKSLVPATVTAYDCSGNVLDTVTAQVGDAFNLPVEMNDSNGRISFVVVDYGDSTCAEAIDDLAFAEGGGSCTGGLNPTIQITTGDDGAFFNTPDQYMSGYLRAPSGFIKQAYLNGNDLPFRYKTNANRYYFHQPITLQPGENHYTLRGVSGSGKEQTENRSYLYGTPSQFSIQELHLTQRGVIKASACDIDSPLVAGKSGLALVKLDVKTDDGTPTYIHNLKMNVFRVDASGDSLVGSVWGTTLDDRPRFRSAADVENIHFWLPASYVEEEARYRFEFQAYLDNNPIGPTLAKSCNPQNAFSFFETQPIRAFLLPSPVSHFHASLINSDHPAVTVEQLYSVIRTYPLSDLPGWYSRNYYTASPFPMCDGSQTMADNYPDICQGTGWEWQFRYTGIDQLSRMNVTSVVSPTIDACNSDNHYIGGMDNGGDLITTTVNSDLGIFMLGAGKNGWDGERGVKYIAPVDQDWDGQLSGDEIIKYVGSFLDQQTNTWMPAASFNQHYDAGETFRFFEDQDGDYCNDSETEPQAPIVSKNKKEMLYDPQLFAMRDYNLNTPGTFNDLRTPAMILPDMFIPNDLMFSAAIYGQRWGDRMWSELMSNSTVFVHEMSHAAGGLPDRYGDSIADDLQTQEGALWVYVNHERLNPTIADTIMGTNERLTEVVHLQEDYQTLYNKLRLWLNRTASAGQDESVFNLFGWLDESGQVENLSYQAGTGLELTPSDPTSPYKLVFGSGGSTLSTYPFAIHQGSAPSDESPLNQTSVPFEVVAPMPGGTDWVELRHEDSPLERFEVSSHAPTVTLLEPNGGQSFSGSEVVTVRWSGADADGDVLSYSLYYSPDGGSSWTLLGPPVQGSQWSWDLGNAVGTDGVQGLIRVVASDGFNRASDESDGAFSIAGKPPAAAILAPKSDQAISPCGNIHLEGLALDPESQVTTTVWKLDGVQVSSEAIDSVEAPLPGTHTLRFEVTDGDGFTTHQETIINVLTDSDCDGMPDDFEDTHGFSNDRATDAWQDADQDQLDNVTEYHLGTHPHDSDTDGDGFGDGREYFGGSDPLDPNDVPIKNIFLPLVTR